MPKSLTGRQQEDTGRLTADELPPDNNTVRPTDEGLYSTIQDSNVPQHDESTLRFSSAAIALSPLNLQIARNRRIISDAVTVVAFPF